jgi:hypothetical protein
MSAFLVERYCQSWKEIELNAGSAGIRQPKCMKRINLYKETPTANGVSFIINIHKIYINLSIFQPY